MMQYSTTPGVQGICPTGWHLPTNVEWTTLTTYLGGETVAGGKMKEAGTAHWSSPNTGATNSSGFTALPGGNWNGYFFNLTNSAYFWSSMEFSSAGAWARNLTYNHVYVTSYTATKTAGFSARCVQDWLFDYFIGWHERRLRFFCEGSLNENIWHSTIICRYLKRVMIYCWQFTSRSVCLGKNTIDFFTSI